MLLLSGPMAISSTRKAGSTRVIGAGKIWPTSYHMIMIQAPFEPQSWKNLAYSCPHHQYKYYYYYFSLMLKMSHSGYNHDQPFFLTIINTILFSDRTAWLDKCCNAGLVS